MSKTYSSSYANVVLNDAGYNPVSITAAGTITGTNVALAGVGGIVWTITNSGRVAGGTTAGAIGISLSAGGNVANTTSASIGGHTGVQIYGAVGAVLNSGSIVGSGAQGVVLFAGGSVTNQSDGTIAGATQGVRLHGTAGLTNSGSISGGAFYTGADLDSGTVTNLGGRISGGAGGVRISSGTGTVVNAGTIAATGTTGLPKGVNLLAGGSVTNQTGGVISGVSGVYVYSAPGTIINDGLISASSGPGINMTGGGSVTNLANGTIQSDNLPVYIGGGATLVNHGSILFTGYAGYSARLGAGFTNRVVITPGAVFSNGVDGGNTIGAAAISTLQLASSAGTGTIGSQFINFAAIEVDNGAAWTINSVLASGVALTNNGSLVGRVQMQPSVHLTNNLSGVITEGLYDAVYAGNSSAPITVINAGKVTQTGTQAAIRGLGGISVNNTGSIVGGNRGVDIGGTGTVTNTGTIGASNTTGAGIILRGGGSVSNAATGTITAGSFGVYLSGGGSIVNDGSIAGGGNAGVAMDGGGALTNHKGATISGHYEAVAANAVFATVVNNGRLLGPTGSGLVMNKGASVTNQSDGVISALDTGVGISGAGGTVVNRGSITGTNNNGVGLFAGGSVSNLSGGTIIGYNGVQISGGVGTVTNAGSIVANGGFAVRLAAGYAHLVAVTPGAAFTGRVDGGNTIGSATISTLELGSAGSAGVLSGLGTQFTNFATISVAAGATWTLSGDNTVTSGVTFTALSGAVVADTGTLHNDGLIVLDPSTLTVADLAGSGTVTIDDGSTLTVQGAVASGETISFADAGGWLDLDTPGGMTGRITSFEIGDTIDLKGVDPNSVSFAGGKLSFTGGSFALSLAIGGQVQATASADGAAVSVLCFCANTLILTPDGQIPVQHLVVGDTVLTECGVVRRIVWIGHGRVLATRGRRSAATPVIVRKGAIAENVPNCDLRLTKGHALHLDQALIPVEFLVNHRTIEWDDHAQEVELYHIELETHDVLVANGAPAESYRDDGNRWLFRNASSGWDQPPKPPFAPVLTGGPVVDAVWRRLLDRAGPRNGPPLTDDPDLHLLVDGRRLDGEAGPDGLHVFRLATRPRDVRIVSRSGVPEELGRARDPRSLGVALRRVLLWQVRRITMVHADDERLAEGFHAYEARNDLRWTDGNAALPAALFASFAGPMRVELHLVMTTSYPAAQSATRAA